VGFGCKGSAKYRQLSDVDSESRIARTTGVAVWPWVVVDCGAQGGDVTSFIGHADLSVSGQVDAAGRQTDRRTSGQREDADVT